MTRPRPERRWAAGTRVRFITPGWSFHRTCGTVGMTAGRTGPVLVLMDGKGASTKAVCTVGSSELAKLRDQSPRGEHQPPNGEWRGCWWVSI